MQYLVVNSHTKVEDLTRFFQQAGPNAVVRSKGNMLYWREQRTGSSIGHAAQYATGQTQAKRSDVMKLVTQVLNNDNLKLNAQAEGRLQPKELKHLLAHDGDLKVDHLMRMLTSKIDVGGRTIRYVRSPFNEGAYGKIYKAETTADGEDLVFKTPVNRNSGEYRALVREADRHLQAWQAGAGNQNYVVSAHSAVTDAEGQVFQPMKLAICSGGQLLGHFRVPEDVDEIDRALVVFVRDGVGALAQLRNAGLVHRDFKPENMLLSKEGVFQVTDFGTASDPDTVFTNTGGKKGGRNETGLSSSYMKSPEWLEAELPKIPEAREYTVGPEADVFQFGVAVYRLLFGGKPFDHPAETTELGYEAQVLAYGEAYKETGVSYCEWASTNYGVDIPPVWRDFFNMTLHADPKRRATVDELQELPLITAPLGVPEAEVRAQLVAMGKSATRV